MNTYTVTITSKNQITLPAQLVKRLQLARGKRLQVTEQDGCIEMTAHPSLQDRLAPFHTEMAKHLRGRSLSEKELNDSLRGLYAKKIVTPR